MHTQIYMLWLGTAPWEINFAYFLVSRTIFYALSDGNHKKIRHGQRLL